MDRSRTDLVQIYETHVVDPNTWLNARVVVVPHRRFDSVESWHSPIDYSAVLEELELTGIAGVPSIRSLPTIVATALMNPSADEAPQVIHSLLAEWRGDLSGDVGRALKFAERLVFEPVIPIETSPLSKEALGTLLSKAAPASAATAVGVVAAGGNLLILATVPAAIILLGAAAGVGKALEEGLRYKILRWMRVPQRPEEGEAETGEGTLSW